MSYHPSVFEERIVVVVSIMSQNKRIHLGLKKYVGRAGRVIATSKNNMLLVEFSNANRKMRTYRELRCIPSSCVVRYGDCKILW